MSSSPVCVITGVGPGNGAAFSAKMAREGYRVAMLARSEERLRELEQKISGSKGYAADVGDAAAVREVFARIKRELGPVSVLIHNAGSGMFASFSNTNAEMLELAWRVNTLALLLCGHEVLPDMTAAGGGSIIVIGATASLRGGANFTAFASAKAAQRSLAQSMARGLGAQGIHVAYVIVDGVIDIPNTRAMFSDRPDDFFLAPEHIADTVFFLVRQPRSAWTFEIDVRPFGEKW
jgi:NAD(P)-dependent dehydrogenase (short-subunit alcohol dehydrogenase family)